MRKQLEEFEVAIELSRKDPDSDKLKHPDCRGHEDEFIHYEADEVPDEETAALLCERCPLLDLCYKSATKSKPEWGVWGGVVWYRGKQLRWLERFGYIEPGTLLDDEEST